MTTELLLLTYNRLGVVSRCLRSILPGLSQDVTLHLWDNASTDGTAQWLLKLRDRYPAQVRVTLAARNYGHAMARREQLAQATGDTIGILDSDVEMLAPNWLAMLLDALERPGVGVVGQGGHILNPDYTFRTMPPSYDGEVDYLSGFSQFFRRDVLERGVQINPAYEWGGAEDDDFVFQIKALGLKAWMVGNLPMKHVFAGTWDGTNYQRNRALWQATWAGKGLCLFEQGEAD